MRIAPITLVSAVSATLTAGAAAAMIAAPMSSAQPADECTNTDNAVVCQYQNDFSNGGGESSGADNANDQNGSYGPSGNLPPVGN